MTTSEEWRIAFDLYWNNISSDKAPGLNDYERSVFLSDAQDGVVSAMYSGKAGGPLEKTEETTQYLSRLVREFSTEEFSTGTLYGRTLYCAPLPEDVWFRMLETCTLSDGGLLCGGTQERVARVVPVTHDEFMRTADNPFKGPDTSAVLSLTPNLRRAELVSAWPVAAYTLRYLRRPRPIILSDLPGGLTIRGSSSESLCELHDALHSAILQAAVAMARGVWENTVQTQQAKA